MAGYTKPRMEETAGEYQAAERLCAKVRDLMGERVLSMVLHGSAVMEDLVVGYSDLDFLLILSGEITPDDCDALKRLRLPFRDGVYGSWGWALEGAFLPRMMLNPAVVGRAFWWGTSSERVWESNQLGWFTLWVVREKGLVVWGEDLRREIPPPPNEGLAAQVREFCVSARQHGKGESVKTVDWLLTAARLLKWVEGGAMSSKSDGADWALRHAEGSWRTLLPTAKEMRLHPEQAKSSEAKTWLAGLQGPIADACRELEAALANKMSLPEWRNSRSCS